MSEQSYINCLNYLFRRLTLLNLTLVYLEYFTILPLFWNQKFDKFKTAKIQTFSTSFCTKFNFQFANFNLAADQN